MKTASRVKKTSLYGTWYEFKKELEKRLGHRLLNWDWLAVKPQAPLPWNDSDMSTALWALAHLQRRKKQLRHTAGGSAY